MDSWAVCNECGNRYDTRAARFCTRCGSTATAAPDKRPAPVPGAQAARRRARLGGLILIALGALVALGCALALVQLRAPHDELGPALASSAAPQSGSLHLTILDNGTPVPADVRILAPDGQVLHAAQAGLDGRLDLALTNVTTYRLEAVHLGHNTTRHGLLFLQANTTAAIDLADAPPHDWIGLAELVRIGTIGTMLVGAFALLAVVGGALAVAARAYPVAIAAALPMPLVSLLLVAAFLNAGVLVFFLLQATGLGLVVASRAAFRRGA